MGGKVSAASWAAVWCAYRRMKEVFRARIAPRGIIDLLGS